MAAILQTAGQYSTGRAVKCNWRFLRMLTSSQYKAAAQELQALNIGSFIALHQAKGKPTPVFVKKPPEEVWAILEANRDLCPADYYRMRYLQPLSTYIPASVREKLVQMGLAR